MNARPTKKIMVANECVPSKKSNMRMQKAIKPILRCCFHFENMNKAQKKKHEEAT